MKIPDGPILHYPGGKWNIAPWVVLHFPPHIHYIEPFFGGGSVFFHKVPARHEVINDLSGDVVNLFRMIRERGEDLAAALAATPYARAEYELSYQPTDDPLERARRFVVRVRMAHSSKLDSGSGWRSAGIAEKYAAHPATWRTVADRVLQHIDRLRDAEIESRPALDVIQRYNTPDALIYADPPYVLSTRAGTMYQHEMTDEQHIELLDALDAHCGPVVLSGYASPIYDDRLGHWQRVQRLTETNKKPRQEVLWVNPVATRQQSAPSLFDYAQRIVI